MGRNPPQTVNSRSVSRPLNSLTRREDRNRDRRKSTSAGSTDCQPDASPARSPSHKHELGVGLAYLRRFPAVLRQRDPNTLNLDSRQDFLATAGSNQHKDSTTTGLSISTVRTHEPTSIKALTRSGKPRACHRRNQSVRVPTVAVITNTASSGNSYATSPLL